MVTLRDMDCLPLDSRISIMRRIMEALGDANINKIGIWGLPGVGKSTLVKEIFKKAREEGLFHEVAVANVTDKPDLRRIQGEIAEMLDLELDLNKRAIVRACCLRARLEKEKEKKILVILDDIWKELDLEEIGIIPSERCKVLLTSRNRQVLAIQMVTEENNFKLDILGEQEAWKLFEKVAGDSIKDDQDLQNVAIKVARACAGLPMALVTVSRALKNHKNLRSWKDALMQLTRPTPTRPTPDPLSIIYYSIELSYNRLVGREVKSLFLFCAQQDCDISYRDLLRYGFGLGLFTNIYRLEEARYKLDVLISVLQDSCLLQQSPRSFGEFFMHEHVRHVARIIASNYHYMIVLGGDGGRKAWPDVDALKSYKALSILGEDHIQEFFNEIEYPIKIECPELRYFHVQCKNGLLKFPNISFSEMDKIEVLRLTNMQLSSLLPLTNLQTLCLEGCNLGDIHGIGELKTLVILSLARSNISNLPGEIRLLTHLQLLDLSDCSRLRVIPPNVLSSLVNLEELYMQNNNVHWEVEGLNNASLAELKKLSHLVILEMDIRNGMKLPTDLFSEKLERYKIRIGDIHDPFPGEAFSRTLGLNMSFQSDFGIKMLLKTIEYLYLDDSNNTTSVLYELDGEEFQKMISLEEICQGNLPSTSFKNLKVLKVENCDKLRFIFSLSIAMGLSQLKELIISKCNNVCTIFVKEEEDRIVEARYKMLFDRLQTLVLEDLPKLGSFLSARETNSEGNHDLRLTLLHHQLSFPSLKTLYLENLPKIKLVWSKSDLPILHRFEVKRCENLKSLFPAASVDTSLTQLKHLEIKDCGVLEEIVAREDGTDPTTRLLFPGLIFLSLDGLPKLKWFFQGLRTSESSSSSKELHEKGGTLFGVEEVSFPNLTNLYLSSLPKIKHVWSRDSQTILRFLQQIAARNCACLKSLFPASIVRCLEQLEKISIYNCGVEEIVEAEVGETVGRTLVFMFPKVTSLYLAKLPRLECFYKGVHISKWPMLKEMSIHECEKVEIFASILVNFEKTVGEKPSQMSIKQPLFLVDEMPFPSLEILEIYKMEKLEIIWNIKDSHQRHMYNFQNLLYIDVSLCENLKSLFPAASVAASLLQLQCLMITGCGVLEEIVAREEETDPTRVLFPSLICLGLYGLPELKWFFQGVRTSESSSSKELHEQGGTLFVVKEVAFPCLKLLDLYGLSKIKHVWSKDSQTIPTFQNLQVIIAGKCASLKSLFPTSIVRCLEQLKEIKIYDCGVEEIVAAEGGEALEMTFVFPEVTSLRFENLRRLECFYKGWHDSKWLMLKEMRILECEKVKRSFPSLVTFEVRRMYESEIMSRNVTIRNLWRSCYARCLHANESHRLTAELMPKVTHYKVKMRAVSPSFDFQV